MAGMGRRLTAGLGGTLTLAIRRSINSFGLCAQGGVDSLGVSADDETEQDEYEDELVRLLLSKFPHDVQ